MPGVSIGIRNTEMPSLPGRGSRQQKAGVGVPRVRGPDLLAVDAIARALLLGARAQRGEVRARLRFGETLAPEGLTSRHRRNVALLLLGGAEAHERRTDPVDVHVLAAARLAGLPHFLGQDERRPGTASRPPQRFGQCGTSRPASASLRAKVLRERALRLGAWPVRERLPVRGQMGCKKSPDRGTKCLLLDVPIEMHQVLY